MWILRELASSVILTVFEFDVYQYQESLVLDIYNPLNSAYEISCHLVKLRLSKRSTKIANYTDGVVCNFGLIVSLVANLNRGKTKW